MKVGLLLPVEPVPLEPPVPSPPALDPVDPVDPVEEEEEELLEVELLEPPPLTCWPTLTFTAVTVPAMGEVRVASASADSALPTWASADVTAAWSAAICALVALAALVVVGGRVLWRRYQRHRL